MDSQHDCFDICVERTGEIEKGIQKTLSRLLIISPHKDKFGNVKFITI